MATNPDPNGGAFEGPYIDPAITKAPVPWGPHGQDANTTAPNPPGTVADPDPADEPGARPQVVADTHKETPVYDVPGVNHEPGEQGAVKPPHSPNSWKTEDQTLNAGTAQESTQSYPRDPYRNNGMIGQTFMRNQG